VQSDVVRYAVWGDCRLDRRDGLSTQNINYTREEFCFDIWNKQSHIFSGSEGQQNKLFAVSLATKAGTSTHVGGENLINSLHCYSTQFAITQNLR